MFIDPISIEYSAPYYAAALIFGYLLGSIPFGLLFTKMAGLGDIRNVGSGNIGATNVLRTGNRWVALATLIADGGIFHGGRDARDAGPVHRGDPRDGHPGPPDGPPEAPGEPPGGALPPPGDGGGR